MSPPSDHQTLWRATTTPALYPALDGPTEADVAVVGAGITGLTTALLLVRQGLDVVVLEAGAIGSGVTGGTTAHITSVVDSRYHTIAKRFGQEAAGLLASSCVGAIDRVEALVAELSIDCGFERLPGYLYAEDESHVEGLEQELEAARAAGLRVESTDDVPLPFPIVRAMRIDRQAQFHPLRYLEGLAGAFLNEGGRIYGGTRVTDVRDGSPCQLTVKPGGQVTARRVVLATHTPLGRNVVHAALPAYRSYALAVRLNRPLPRGLFWDMADPYHYTRRQATEEGELLIVGGADHKTGEGEPEESFRKLRAYTGARFDVAEVVHQWSAQWYQPTDDLPLIGLSPGAEATLIATGFLGDGMVFGTVAAEVLTDLIAGRQTPLAELYRPARLKLAETRDFLEAGVDTAKNLVLERLTRGDLSSLEQLAPDCGAVLRIGARKVAAFRTTTGRLRTFSAVCPHMGCVIQYNPAEKSFDCPCHGSRFDGQGRRLEGPTTNDLDPVDVD